MGGAQPTHLTTLFNHSVQRIHFFLGCVVSFVTSFQCVFVIIVILRGC
jgi:hypothetical protein